MNEIAQKYEKNIQIKRNKENNKAQSKFLESEHDFPNAHTKK